MMHATGSRLAAAGGLAVLAITLDAQGTRPRDARANDAKAAAIVERGRAAFSGGGDRRDLRSLVLRGRVRVPQEGSRFDEGEVVIKMLLPDRFLRTDTVGGSTKLSRDRTQFARLMLGVGAYLVPDQKLTVRSTGEEAFEDTTAVDVDGGGFSARLVFDLSTGLPLRLTYFEKGSVSTVMSFADRRPVDGFVLPFRVSTQTPQRVLETLAFDDILVNPPLTKDDFQR